MPNKALITGITGQDGSYLAELLLSKGYEVHGIIRRASTFNTKRIDHIYQDPHETNRRLFLHYGDLADAESIRKLIYSIQPDEIYNMGAQSHVRVSFDIPEYTANIDALGNIRILEAIRDFQDNTGKKIKFYQASSSEIFGSTPPPQNERSPFHPRSPYGCSKAFAYHATVNYREAYGMFAVNGILFNHESPRRGETFVTKKITRGIARIKAGLDKKIYLGNLDARRDWGYAPEYMEAAWLMMQEAQPDDYVIGTGESHSVQEFIEIAFGLAEIPNWKDYIGIDPKYYRPTEVQNLVADTTKARTRLGWQPKTKFHELVAIMLEEDLKQYGITLKSSSRQTIWETPTREKNAKIYVAGHTGLVGSAIIRALKHSGYTNIIYRTHDELDLTDQKAVNDFFAKEKPEYVYLAAAKVGGIHANNTYPADFIFQNIQIETNVIHESCIHEVKKLLFLGSTCIYPKHAPQPMKEEHLLTNTLEPTNEPYAIAKIAGIKMCQSYNRQYGTNFIAAMPTNLYGINDNFHPMNSHVIPALLRRFHEAKIKNAPGVIAWGTGSAVREFLNVDDLGEACVFLMENFNPTKEQNEKGDIFLNAGTGEGITIKELTELIKKTVGYEGQIVWDTTKPDGTPKKVSDVTRIHSLGWHHKINLGDGLLNAYKWYVNSYETQTNDIEPK